jgi:hypothetical protein
MTDQSRGRALEVLPRPERIREELSHRVREVKLLRQMLRLSQRVSIEFRARQETGEQ